MNSTYFAQACPACGRTVQIKLTYLGRQMCCVHCNCEFVATDKELESAGLDDPVNYWLNFTTNQDEDFGHENGLKNGRDTPRPR